MMQLKKLQKRIPKKFRPQQDSNLSLQTLIGRETWGQLSVGLASKQIKLILSQSFESNSKQKEYSNELTVQNSTNYFRYPIIINIIKNKLPIWST